MAIGTAPYMSPEQARDEPLDVRTDLFSLGAVLYEMAAGKQAFPGRSTAEVLSALLTATPVAPSELNANVPPELDYIISKALEKDRALRYQSAAEMRADLKRLQRDTDSGRAWTAAAGRRHAVLTRARRFRLSKVGILSLAAVALLVAAAVTAHFRLRHAPSPPFAALDNIVLADFTNKTGEAVFDDTLKQALRVQLEQSPFLNALSDERVSQTLSYMGKPRDTRLTKVEAREVCLRTGSKAMLLGSIAMLGSHYAVNLEAVNCSTGDSLGAELAEADSREHVLKAVGEAATKMRARLGESLASIQKYDAPVEQATTPSLEALQAYSLGMRKVSSEGDAAGVPFLARATELDPNFAQAYASLGNLYANLNKASLAMGPIRRAFELRGRVSERERFYIDSCYYGRATGEIEKAAQVCELWKQTYPGDVAPHVWLGNFYQLMGRFDRALEECREVVRMHPTSGTSYANLANLDLILGRVEEAQQVLAQAQARGFTSPAMQVFLYRLAFLRGDHTEMEHRIAAAAGQPAEDMLLAQQAGAEAYYGHLAKARELTRRTLDSALRDGRTEAAASFRAVGALREAAFGNREQARREAAAALGMSPGKMVRTLAALAMARAGDITEANQLAGELHQQAPADTILDSYWLPTIRAYVAINRQMTRTSAPAPLALRGGAAALELLEPVRPYELELPTLFWVLNVTLCPVEARGEAYLAMGRDAEAAAEFQKILDHPSLVATSPIGAVARLGLARAYALQAGVNLAAETGAGTPPAAGAGSSPRPRPWPALAPLIRISSPCGRMPTLTSPSSSKPKRSTPGCSNPRSKIQDARFKKANPRG